MVKHGLTLAKLARELGVSKARVCQMLNILKLPENILAECRSQGDREYIRVLKLLKEFDLEISAMTDNLLLKKLTQNPGKRIHDE